MPNPQILAVAGVTAAVIPTHGLITFTFTELYVVHPVVGLPPPTFGVTKLIAYSSTSPQVGADSGVATSPSLTITRILVKPLKAVPGTVKVAVSV